MHGQSLECCKDAASEECFISIVSIHKALVFCYFSFSQVSSCSMVYGPIALALYLMVFTCCLTVLLLWSDSVQLSWPGGRLPEHFLMGLFKFLDSHLFLINFYSPVIPASGAKLDQWKIPIFVSVDGTFNCVTMKTAIHQCFKIALLVTLLMKVLALEAVDKTFACHHSVQIYWAEWLFGNICFASWF